MLSRTFWTRLETQEFIHLYTITNKQNFILRGVGGGGEGRDPQQSFIRRSSAPMSNPLTFYKYHF